MRPHTRIGTLLAWAGLTPDLHRGGKRQSGSDGTRRSLGQETQSIRLRPLNRTAFRLLADVLYSVDSTQESDTEALEIGSIVYPREASIPLGQAAVALRNGDAVEAERLVELALGDMYRLEAAERSAAEALLRRLGQ